MIAGYRGIWRRASPRRFPGLRTEGRRHCDLMNHIGSRPLLLCTGARSRDERRKPAQSPWCTVGCHPVPQKYRWADAATSAQLSDTTAHARARGVTLPKTSNLIGKDKPRVVTTGYRSGTRTCCQRDFGSPRHHKAGPPRVRGSTRRGRGPARCAEQARTAGRVAGRSPRSRR